MERMDERLRAVIEESAELHGAHLIEVVLRGSEGRAVIEVFVDTEAGVTTDLCALISRELSRRIDAGELIAGSYRLEVSSPGIERPLKYRWQYTKHVGRAVRVRRKSADLVDEVAGTIAALDESALSVQTPRGGPLVVIPFESIVESRIAMPW
jgi:ribosome maturation factor RimP